MISLVFQHSWLWLWLVASLLTGFLSHWLLELFFFRQRMFDLESRLRRRGEELDSEKFAHGRTATELRGRTEALATSQKENAELLRLRNEARLRAEQEARDFQAARTKMDGLQDLIRNQAAELVQLKQQVDSSREESTASAQLRDEAKGQAERAAMALAHVRADVAGLEAKLKGRSEELREINDQWGSAREAAIELGEKLVQAEARLAAGQQTRRTLEAELKVKDRELSELREKGEDLEAELRATSASHEALQLELAKWTTARDHSELPSEGSADREPQLWEARLNEITAERDKLAAELAELRPKESK